MNKAALIDAISERAHLGKKDAENAVEGIFLEISESLKRGEKVAIVGFGSFERARRKAKMARNPQTGEPMPVPPRFVPKFTASTIFKKMLAALPVDTAG